MKQTNHLSLERNKRNIEGLLFPQKKSIPLPFILEIACKRN